MNLKEEGIDYGDISVVVQGAIAGLPSDKEQDRHTYTCLKSIRKVLPGATIILSTWEGSNVRGLDYDVLVQSKDPGVVNLGGVSSNVFRQIVSTMNGLKVCRTKYVVKARTDLLFKSDKFLRYFVKFNKLPFDENYKILKKRVVMLTSNNPKRRTKLPFHPGDWFHFGLTEDVRNIFDIPLIKKDISMQDANGVAHRVDSLFSAEQYIWFSFLSKNRTIPFEYTDDISHDNIATSEKYFANNCIFLTVRRAGIDSLKYPGIGCARTPALGFSGYYTFTDYKRMLNKYASNHLLIIPNPVEEVAYFVVYNLRFLFNRHRTPMIHGLLRRFNREDLEYIKTKNNPKAD